MDRSSAALRHLWPSILILAAFACLILFAWYPYPFLQFTNGGKFSLLLVISACFAGPALTWVVYKKGKWGMTFDLVVIGLIQVAALGWGVHTLYQGRPYFMVFTADRFEVFSTRDVDLNGIENPKFLEKPFASPVLLYATMPKQGPDYQKLLREIMFEGKPDLQFRPEFWSLYTDKQQLVLEVSAPLLELRRARPTSANAIDTLVKNNGGDIGILEFVPAMLPNGQFAAILDAHSGKVIDTLVIDPWLD